MCHSGTGRIRAAHRLPKRHGGFLQTPIFLRTRQLSTSTYQNAQSARDTAQLFQACFGITSRFVFLHLLLARAKGLRQFLVRPASRDTRTNQGRWEF